MNLDKSVSFVMGYNKVASNFSMEIIKTENSNISHIFSNSKWSPTRSLGKERKHFTLILYTLNCFNVLRLLFWQLNERNNNPIISLDVLFFKSKMKVHDTDFTRFQRKFILVSNWLIWNLKLLVKNHAKEDSTHAQRSAISEERNR